MVEKYKLDVKDRKILAELDNNARQSNNQIGKKVRLSKEVVKYRIDKMISAGVIVKFYAIVNYFKLGIYKHKLYLRLTNASKEKIEEIGQYFLKHKKTEWDVWCTGRWDMNVSFLVHNVNEFDDEVQKVMDKFSKYIQEKAVTTTLYLAHNIRGFLGTKKPEVVYYTSKDPKEKIDSLDEEIIKIIANNARMPATEIAERLKVTPRVIQYRIREMERRKIILAYRALLSPRAMGRVFCKAIIYLENVNQERLNEFIFYVSSISDVVWPMKVMGAWDFELDCEVENYDRFQDIILDLKAKFPTLIKNHEFFIVSKEFKLDFYPGAYPQVSSKS